MAPTPLADPRCHGPAGRSAKDGVRRPALHLWPWTEMPWVRNAVQVDIANNCRLARRSDILYAATACAVIPGARR